MQSHPTHHGAHPQGPVAHEPSPAAEEAYRQAFAAAQPDPGRRVIPIELEAREVDWEFVPGTTTRAWSYNGQIPGPTLEGQVGDVLRAPCLGDDGPFRRGVVIPRAYRGP
jgi:nitrite reductase (NO-forming)